MSRIWGQIVASPEEVSLANGKRLVAKSICQERSLGRGMFIIYGDKKRLLDLKEKKISTMAIPRKIFALNPKLMMKDDFAVIFLGRYVFSK